MNQAKEYCPQDIEYKELKEEEVSTKGPSRVTLNVIINAPVIKVGDFSNWYRFRKVIVHVFRFLKGKL